MATNIYEIETPDYSTTGWNGILKNALETIDELMHTWMSATIGTDVDEGDALYVQNNGKWYKSIADDTHRPAQAVAVEEGVRNTTIRIQLHGPFTLSTWSWIIGKGVWLSSGTWGGMTQTKPANHAQFLGIAIDVDTVNLNIHMSEGDLLPASTTTTTTTTSSTASTTSSFTTTTTV